MSSSDEDFQPLAITNLEKFKEESSIDPEKADPDFDRFTALFDTPEFNEETSGDFSQLYQFKSEPEEKVFKPLIEGEKEDQPRPEASDETLAGDETGSGGEPEQEPELTPEEKGFQKGFEQGLAQGETEGKENGYQEGFEKGRKEGFEKGEEEGLESGEDKGLEQGLAKGEAQAIEQVKEEAQARIETLEKMVTALESTLETLVDTYETRIVDLIGHIAKKVILTHVEMDDETVKPLVLQALKTLVDPEDIILTVSAEDYEYIEMIKDDFFDQVETLSRISVRSDSALDKGDFHIETNTAQISSDIETQLETIAQAMKSAGGH